MIEITQHPGTPSVDKFPYESYVKLSRHSKRCILFNFNENESFDCQNEISVVRIGSSSRRLHIFAIQASVTIKVLVFP